MKYNVVKNKVEVMGYGYNDNGCFVEIFDKEYNCPVAKISKLKPFSISTTNTSFLFLDDIERKVIGKIVFDIAWTPPEEREEKKLYRLKFVGHVDDGYEYLYILNGQRAMDIIDLATIFTESELKDIDETGFIREEVTE